MNLRRSRSIASPRKHSLLQPVPIDIENPKPRTLKPETFNPTMTVPSNNANASVQAIIDHVFKDPALLAEALHAAGTNYQNIQGRFVLGDNKRLALLGDSVLHLALVDHWYPQGGTRSILKPGMIPRPTTADLHLGDSNNIVQRIGSNANLCIIGRQVGLESHIIVPASHFGAVSDKTVATTVEALLGAVFLDTDKNIDAVKSVMQALGLGLV